MLASPALAGDLAFVTSQNADMVTLVDTATGTVPIAGDLVDTFFPGQLMAARALQKHIETTHWVEDSEANARASGDHARHEATVQADEALKRIVYLHD